MKTLIQSQIEVNGVLYLIDTANIGAKASDVPDRTATTIISRDKDGQINFYKQLFGNLDDMTNHFEACKALKVLF